MSLKRLQAQIIIFYQQEQQCNGQATTNSSKSMGNIQSKMHIVVTPKMIAMRIHNHGCGYN